MIIRHKTKASQRKSRVRKKIATKSNRLRLSVFRSSLNIYAQIIDDKTSKTLVSATQKDIKYTKSTTKLEKAKLIGSALAQKALKKKITHIVFDRGQYKYHGRVKALADKARENGLKF